MVHKGPQIFGTSALGGQKYGDEGSPSTRPFSLHSDLLAFEYAFPVQTFKFLRASVCFRRNCFHFTKLYI